MPVGGEHGGHPVRRMTRAARLRRRRCGARARAAAGRAPCAASARRGAGAGPRLEPGPRAGCGRPRRRGARRGAAGRRSRRRRSPGASRAGARRTPSRPPRRRSTPRRRWRRARGPSPARTRPGAPRPIVGPARTSAEPSRRRARIASASRASSPGTHPILNLRPSSARSRTKPRTWTGFGPCGRGRRRDPQPSRRRPRVGCRLATAHAPRAAGCAGRAETSGNPAVGWKPPPPRSNGSPRPGSGPAPPPRPPGPQLRPGLLGLGPLPRHRSPFAASDRHRSWTGSGGADQDGGEPGRGRRGADG